MAKKPKSSNNPENLLVRIKNKLNIAMGIDATRLKLYIDRYVIRTFDGKVNSTATYDKVNAYNELTSDKMTVKVFFKYLAMLDLASIRFTVTIKTIRGAEYTVHEDVNFIQPNADLVSTEEAKEENGYEQ